MSTIPNYSSDQASNSGAIPVRIASSSVSIPVSISSSGALQDSPGAIAAANTSQLALAAATRKYFFIQNSTASTGVLTVDFGRSARSVGSGSIELVPGSSFTQESSFISSDAINVLSSVVGTAYIIKWG